MRLKSTIGKRLKPGVDPRASRFPCLEPNRDYHGCQGREVCAQWQQERGLEVRCWAALEYWRPLQAAIKTVAEGVA